MSDSEEPRKGSGTRERGLRWADKPSGWSLRGEEARETGRWVRALFSRARRVRQEEEERKSSGRVERELLEASREQRWGGRKGREERELWEMLRIWREEREERQGREERELCDSARHTRLGREPGNVSEILDIKFVDASRTWSEVARNSGRDVRALDETERDERVLSLESSSGSDDMRLCERSKDRICPSIVQVLSLSPSMMLFPHRLRAARFEPASVMTAAHEAPISAPVTADGPTRPRPHKKLAPSHML